MKILSMLFVLVMLMPIGVLALENNANEESNNWWNHFYVGFMNPDFFSAGAFAGGNEYGINSIDHANGRETSYGVLTGLGWFNERFNYMVELDYNQRNLNQSDLITTNLRVIITYDVLRFLEDDKLTIYVGIGAGLGYAWTNDEYPLLTNNKEDAPLGNVTGALEFRSGVKYKINDKTEIDLFWRLGHLSKPFYNDAGSNPGEGGILLRRYF